MFDVKGKYTTATIYTDNIESDAVSNVYALCNHPIFENADIKIMPDVHQGSGCNIGTTISMSRKAVIPNIVGVDIGCGVLATVFETDLIDFKKLDDFIKAEIPFGMSVRIRKHPDLKKEVKSMIEEVVEELHLKKLQRQINIIGTLGGGNHYIEIGQIDANKYLLSIHSGSRDLGRKVCDIFQLRATKHVIHNKIFGIPRDMTYVENDDYDDYIRNMVKCQKVAVENRRLMSNDILKFLNANVIESFDTIHNYIEVMKDNIVIRKGAISAKEGEKIAIPLNMRDGIIIGTGKGNKSWNQSAPHGAGRILSRGEAKESLSMKDFEESMKGINTWSVCQSTLDESPHVYKPAEEIINAIRDTVEIIDIVKPVYNFKAH